MNNNDLGRNSRILCTSRGACRKATVRTFIVNEFISSIRLYSIILRYHRSHRKEQVHQFFTPIFRRIVHFKTEKTFDGVRTWYWFLHRILNICTVTVSSALWQYLRYANTKRQDLDLTRLYVVRTPWIAVLIHNVRVLPNSHTLRLLFLQRQQQRGPRKWWSI